jgi:hypothetical protein
VAQRELAVVASEEVQAHARDGVDADLGELEEAEAAHEHRQADRDCDYHDRQDEARAAAHR